MGGFRSSVSELGFCSLVHSPLGQLGCDDALSWMLEERCGTIAPAQSTSCHTVDLILRPVCSQKRCNWFFCSMEKLWTHEVDRLMCYLCFFSDIPLPEQQEWPLCVCCYREWNLILNPVPLQGHGNSAVLSVHIFSLPFLLLNGTLSFSLILGLLTHILISFSRLFLQHVSLS